jgi:hypothetical protein
MFDSMRQIGYLLGDIQSGLGRIKNLVSSSHVIRASENPKYYNNTELSWPLAKLVLAKLKLTRKLINVGLLMIRTNGAA